MTDNIELIKATESYKEERRKLKEIQRRTLEDMLEEDKAELGRAIVTARSERGLTIDDIGLIIGIKNRTFIYDMINAYNRSQQATVTTSDDDVFPTDDPNLYGVEWLDDDNVRVFFSDNEQYYLSRIEGTKNGWELPEEWADHTRERRNQYKQILAELREHAA